MPKKESNPADNGPGRSGVAKSVFAGLHPQMPCFPAGCCGISFASQHPGQCRGLLRQRFGRCQRALWQVGYAGARPARLSVTPHEGGVQGFLRPEMGVGEHASRASRSRCGVLVCVAWHAGRPIPVVESTTLGVSAYVRPGARSNPQNARNVNERCSMVWSISSVVASRHQSKQWGLGTKLCSASHRTKHSFLRCYLLSCFYTLLHFLPVEQRQTDATLRVIASSCSGGGYAVALRRRVIASIAR